jgi:hypothetical protein
VIKQFGISETDYWKLVKESASLRSMLTTNTLGNKGAADSLNATISRLPAELTPGGWHNFREYVNGDYRAHTHIIAINGQTAVR